MNVDAQGPETQDWLDYFAYGSNMSRRRLAARVPSIHWSGRAWLVDYRLVFHKVGRDGSGKCDVLPHAGARVYGVLYRLPAVHRPRLDRHEDLGRGYALHWVDVEREGSPPIRAFTYRALIHDAQLRPYPWYLQHVLQGALENRLPRAYIEQIAASSVVEDPDGARQRRELAIYSDD
jgi:cation transport regulator ChaC